jgi:hypothetical protein
MVTRSEAHGAIESVTEGGLGFIADRARDLAKFHVPAASQPARLNIRQLVSYCMGPSLTRAASVGVAGARP